MKTRVSSKKYYFHFRNKTTKHYVTCSSYIKCITDNVTVPLRKLVKKNFLKN